MHYEGTLLFTLLLRISLSHIRRLKIYFNMFCTPETGNGHQVLLISPKLQYEIFTYSGSDSVVIMFKWNWPKHTSIIGTLGPQI